MSPEDILEMEPEEAFQYLIKIRSELQKDLDTCTGYLIHRVEQDLYEVISEDGIKDLSLESFYDQLKWNSPLRAISAVVLVEGIFELTESDYFDGAGPGHEGDFLDSVKGDAMYYTCLFPDEIGQAFLRILILRGQAFQYSRQVKSGKEQTWKQFLAELNVNCDLWQDFFQTLFSALRHLDFKEIWRERNLDALVFDEDE